MSKVRCFTAAIVAVVLSFTGSVFAETVNEQAASLQPDAWLAAPVDAPGILAIEIEKDPVEPTCFYQIMVK